MANGFIVRLISRIIYAIIFSIVDLIVFTVRGPVRRYRF